MPPEPELLERREPPHGLASLASALAEWDELDADLAAINAARTASRDRRPSSDGG